MNEKLSRVDENKGLLILNQIEFVNCVKRVPIKNNQTSAKVTVPKDWIGKTVYIILKKEEKNG